MLITAYTYVYIKSANHIILYFSHHSILAIVLKQNLFPFLSFRVGMHKLRLAGQIRPMRGQLQACRDLFKIGSRTYHHFPITNGRGHYQVSCFHVLLFFAYEHMVLR